MATLKSVLFLLIVFVALVQCGQEADDSVEIGSPRGHSNRFVRNAGGKREGKTEVEVEKLTLRELPVQKGGLSSPSKLRKLKGQEEDDVLNGGMDSILGMKRIKRSPKKGGGVAKGGGGCKKGRK